MKKFYLFLLLAVTLPFAAKAADWTVTLVIENSDDVIVQKVPYSGDAENIAVNSGENVLNYSINDYLDACSIVVSPVEGKVLKAYKEDGSYDYNAISNGKISMSLSYWTWGATTFYYKVSAVSEEDYRDKTVKVTIDNPEGIRLQLRGNSSFEADKTEYEIAYNSEIENTFMVSTVNSSAAIYSVKADGISIDKKYGSYDIPLVDNSDPTDPYYVQEIVIQQEYPEDINYTIKFAFTNGDEKVIKSVVYNGETIEDFANPDGFVVRPGKVMTINLDPDAYKIESITLNGNNESYYGSSEITKTVTEDMSFVFEATKYKILTATLYVTGAEYISMSTYTYPRQTIELKDGENTLEFSEKSRTFYVEIKDGMTDKVEFTELIDETQGKNYLESSYWGSLDLVDNSALYVKAEPIVFESKVALYFDDLSVLYSGVGVTCGKSKLSGYKTDGYTLFDFREKDKNITFNSMASAVKAYHNDEEFSVNYASYFTITDVKNNDVIKVFFTPDNAIEHTVTFEVSENAFDGYEVKKDVFADVDTTQPVKAVGKTQFTIAPLSRADSKLVVKVGENEIEPVDGVYTFETEGDTTVSAYSASGIEDLIDTTTKTTDVYNLQGIRVLHNADATEVNNLPAGIYVVNGKKVAVK